MKSERRVDSTNGASRAWAPRAWPTLAFSALLLVTAAAQADEPRKTTTLAEWSRGVSVTSPDDHSMRMWLWFYEWHIFGAVAPGQHTRGVWENEITITDDGRTAKVLSANPGISLTMSAVPDGAELLLTVENRSQHDWPKLASMIACFNPGPEEMRNERFANEKTWFVSEKGLLPLTMEAKREIHFNHRLRTAVDREAGGEKPYVWSPKWPKSKVDAIEGLVVRESNDGEWVTGIAWERFLSAQGHNPWECMHLSAHVGPLKRGETRKIRGRIYLFRGDKDDLLVRYRKQRVGSGE